MTTDAPEEIAANVRLAIEKLTPLADEGFGLDRASVAWVDGFIDRQAARPDFDPDRIGGLIGVLGSFLGEAIAVAVNGRWERHDGRWSVALPTGDRCFPFTKVDKQFRGGPGSGDSITSFYDVMVDVVATGRFARARAAEPPGDDPAPPSPSDR